MGCPEDGNPFPLTVLAALGFVLELLVVKKTAVHPP